MKYIVQQVRVESRIFTDYIEVDAVSAAEAERMVEDGEVDYEENPQGSDSEEIERYVDCAATEPAQYCKFETGKTYYARSACDHNCIFRYTVVRRSEKSVWIREAGKHARDTVVRRSISIWDGSEMIYPDGKYSMCTIVKASNVETPANA